VRIRLPRAAVLALALAAGGVCTTVATPAAATAVVGMDLKSLSREAELIVGGRVVALESAWDKGRIRTRITLAAEQVFKGKPAEADRVTFSVLGGEVGGIGQRVPGEATFVVGERVVVFLTDLGVRATVLGMAQGKWRWNPDAPGAELTPDLDALGNLERMGPDARPLPPVVGTPVGLETLRAAVRGAP
jgi:hypothetical protein